MSTESQHHIYGESPALQEVLRAAELVSATDVSVLISGETGTGKELLAHAIHEKGSRQDQPFITINCATLTDDLADAVLFGHQDAALNNTTEINEGCIANAHGGTLLLDEVAELPLSIQSKLLRFLETGECQRMGESETHRYDVRIIAVTNHNLEAQVASGDFRQDLFYRLNIVPLELPALRKRVGDLNVLLDAFFRDLVAEHKMPPPSLTKAALNKLSHYPWPGNIRELRNFAERMLILMSGQTVDVSNLPNEMTDYQATKESNAFVLPASGVDINQLECDLMQQALDNTQGNKSHAARLLGLSRDAFLYRLKKYTISN